MVHDLKDEPWLNSYHMGSFKLRSSMKPYRPMNIYIFLAETTKKFPKNNACIFAGNEIT
jgi:hypothetical protein